MSSTDAIKIIIVGLDGAGKTSLLTLLEKVYGFEDKVKELKPTLGIEYKHRSIFGTPFIFWDFGGQRDFRERYLRNEHYFLGTKLMYYLIDIQDEERFDQSVRYLGNILDIMKFELETEPSPILICFHKSDIEIIHDSTFLYFDRVTMIKDLLAKTYPTLNFEFFATSIYDMATIMLIHSKTINRFIPKTQLLEEVCVKFFTKFPVLRILLIDQTGFPIINFFPENLITNNLQEQIDLQLNYQLRILRRFEDQQHDIPNIQFDSELMDHYLFRFRAVKTSSFMKELNPLNNEKAFKVVDSQNNHTSDINVNYYLLIFAQSKNPILAEDDIKVLISEFQSIIKQ